MFKKRLLILLILVLALSLCAGLAWSGGQQEGTTGTTEAEKEVQPEFPKKAVNFLIPFGAGGSADLVGRALANATEKYLGQPIVPLNKPGAGGGIMYTEVYNSDADGYTLAWNSSSILTSTIIGNVPFKADAFIHVARIGYTAMPIAVLADSPWQTLEEFIAAGKANPSTLKIGNAGTGSGTHLTAVMLAKEAGVEVIHVPLGAKRRVPSLLGKEVEAICVPLPEAAPHVKAGKVRILAMSTAERHPTFNDIPTFKEKGYNVVMDLFRGLSLPKGTPSEVVEILQEAFRKGSADPDFVKVADQKGFLINFQGSKEFGKYMDEQSAIVEAGLRYAELIQ